MTTPTDEIKAAPAAVAKLKNNGNSNGQPNAKSKPAIVPNGNVNPKLRDVSAKTTKVRTRRTRLLNLLDNPDNELWLLRLPVAPQLSSKLKEFSFDLDENTGDISGHLWKNYIFKNLNVSDNIAVSLRDENGDWMAPREIQKSIAVSFQPNTKPFYDSTNSTDNIGNNINTKLPKEPDAEVIESTTKLEPRFPVAGKLRTVVSEKLKKSLEKLVEEKERELPQFQPVSEEMYVEQKTEDEAEDLEQAPVHPPIIPGVRVDSLRKSKPLTPHQSQSQKKKLDIDINIAAEMEIEDPVSQPPTTANTPDGEKEKSTSIDKIPDILNDGTPLISSRNDDNNVMDMDAGKNLSPPIPPNKDDANNNNDDTQPPSQPTVHTQGPVLAQNPILTQTPASILTTGTERSTQQTDVIVDTNAQLPGVEDGLGLNEGNTIEEKRVKKKKKKRKSCKATPAEGEEGTTKKRKKKRKSKPTEVNHTDAEVKEEEGNNADEEGVKKKKKKKKSKSKSAAPKDEELLEGEKEERRREKNRLIMKEIETEEKEEENLEKSNNNNKSSTIAEEGLSVKKKKKSKKRKVSDVNTNGEMPTRKSKKKKRSIVAE